MLNKYYVLSPLRKFTLTAFLLRLVNKSNLSKYLSKLTVMPLTVLLLRILEILTPFKASILLSEKAILTSIIITRIWFAGMLPELRLPVKSFNV
jgi:hypothetical protein